MISFSFPGEPVPKARPRVVKGNTYTPALTLQAERALGWKFKEAARGYTPLAVTEFGVKMTFYCGHKRRRDIDNLVKLCLDALNGVAYKDDAQVTEIRARKVYVPVSQARTEVEVWPGGFPQETAGNHEAARSF